MPITSGGIFDNYVSVTIEWLGSFPVKVSDEASRRVVHTGEYRKAEQPQKHTIIVPKSMEEYATKNETQMLLDDYSPCDILSITVNEIVRFYRAPVSNI